MNEASTTTSDTTSAETETAVQRRVPEPRKSGFGRFLFSAMVLAMVGAGAYATFPIWWPKVQAFVPLLTPEPAEDPRFAGLADRIKMLEDLAQARKKEGDVIQDLEAERAQFSKDLGALMARLETIEEAVTSVRDMADATALKAEAANARQALGRLSDRLERLEGSEGDFPIMMDRIQRLEEQVAAKPPAGVTEPTPTLGMSEAIADIARRVGALEQDRVLSPEKASGTHALVLAVGQLREAVRRGGPFGQALETFRTVAPQDPDTAEAVAALDSYADAGVPTLEVLRLRFGETSAAAHRAGADDPSASWVDKTVNSLSSLVTVRKSGEETDGAVDAGTILVVARTALEGDDLAGAVRSLEDLRGREAEAVSLWLAEARARLVADHALSTLHERAMSSIRPAGS